MNGKREEVSHQEEEVEEEEEEDKDEVNARERERIWEWGDDRANRVTYGNTVTCYGVCYTTGIGTTFIRYNAD